MHKILLTVTLIIISTGCTVAYDSLRNQREQNCYQLEGSADREECIRRSGMSYDEYQKQLQDRDRSK